MDLHEMYNLRCVCEQITVADRRPDCCDKVWYNAWELYIRFAYACFNISSSQFSGLTLLGFICHVRNNVCGDHRALSYQIPLKHNELGC